MTKNIPLVGNCEIQLKQNISFINEMKQNLIKTESEQPRKILLKFWAKFQQFLSIFHCMNESSQNSDCIWQIFQPILAISCKNLLDFYQIKQKL